MTNDRTAVPRPPHTPSPSAATAHDGTTDAARDETEQTTSDHFGAVEGETSPVIPPMHQSSDADEIDPVDETTPG